VAAELSRSRALLLALLGGAVVARAGAAQTIGAPYDTTFAPVCEAGRTMPIDTATITVALHPLQTFGGPDGPERTSLDAPFFAQAVSQYFKRPTTVTLPQPQAWHRSQDDSTDVEYFPGATAVMQLRLSDSGRIVSLGWHPPPASPELRRAIVDAVRAADSAQAFVGLRPETGGGVWLELAGVDSTQAGDYPLAKLRVTYYAVEQPAAPKHIPTPVYPPQFQHTAIDGRVEAQFVIGPDGHIVPNTLRIVSFTHVGFVEAVRDMFAKATFLPARGHGCAFSTVVHQSVRFRIDHTAEPTSPLGRRGRRGMHTRLCDDVVCR
jgi:hypothetical protein